MRRERLWSNQDEKSLNEIVNKYCKAITLIQNREDIIAQLPYPSQRNIPVLRRIIKVCEKEIQVWKTEEDGEVNEAEKSRIINEIERLEMIIEECINRLDEIICSSNEIHLSEHKGKANLIFATTSQGRICFLEDLKNISPEYYMRILKLLNLIQDTKQVASNPEKFRILSSVTRNIQGIREVKDFKLRIYFKPLSDNCVYILMALQKNVDWNTEIQNTLYARQSSQKEEFLRLIGKLNSPSERDRIIQENNQYEAKIREKLSQATKRRGRNEPK